MIWTTSRARTSTMSGRATRSITLPDLSRIGMIACRYRPRPMRRSSTSGVCASFVEPSFILNSTVGACQVTVCGLEARPAGRDPELSISRPTNHNLQQRRAASDSERALGPLFADVADRTQPIGSGCGQPRRLLSVSPRQRFHRWLRTPSDARDGSAQDHVAAAATQPPLISTATSANASRAAGGTVRCRPGGPRTK